MSMSVNVHLKAQENLNVNGYVTQNDPFDEHYAVIQLQNDKIDVCMFAEMEEIDMLIKVLQAQKRKLKATVTIS